MVRQALIPLDGTDASTQIVTCAWPLLTDPELQVELMAVIPSGGSAEAVEDRLEEALDAAATTLRREGHPVRLHLTRGDPATRIVERAAQLGPELLAMATHGRSGLDRWVRGSVTESVLRQVEAPMFLANPRSMISGPRTLRRILVPLDGSPASEAILPLASRIAHAARAEVTLLRVEPLVPRETAPLGQGYDQERVLALIEPQAQRLQGEGLTVERRAAYGIEGVEIMKAAEDHDLVVMSTHGRTGPSRWWFGSVADQLLRHCTKPLVVQRVG